jgi:translocation and assembly module TamB
MRRVLKWIGWIVVALIAVPVLAVAVVLIGANTDPGRRLIERETTSLTGGMLKMSGLSGRFPDELRVGHLEVADARGAYLTLENVTLDWSPTALLHRTVLIERLATGTLDLPRMPESSTAGTSPGSSSSSSELPMKVVLKQLEVRQARIGKDVAGASAVLSLTGAGSLESLSAGEVRLAIQRLDAGGQYSLDGTIDSQTVRATLKVDEPAQGLISGIADLPDLGAIVLDATVNGPLTAITTDLKASAGPLRARVNGTVDAEHQTADLAIAAQAPRMTPRPDVSWQSVDLSAKVRGPFASPDATGTVRIADLRAAGAAIAALNAEVAGNTGTITLKAEADGLHLPVPKAEDLMAEAPLLLDATVRLDQPDRPVTFDLRHPRLTARGDATTGNAIGARVALEIPDLRPFAAVGGIDLEGRTSLTFTAHQQGDTTSATMQGTLGITGGMAPVPALIGTSTRLDLAASMHGQDVTVSRLVVSGKAIDVDASGTLKDNVLAADWQVALSELAAVQPTLAGRLEAKGHAGGKLDDLAVVADLTGEVGGEGYRPGPVAAHVEARGLPSSPQAAVTAHGTLLDSPLDADLAASYVGGAAKVAINRLDWKSAHARGDLALASGATIPTGQLTVAVTRLTDLAPLVGQQIAGSLQGALDADEKTAKLTATARDITVPGTLALSRLKLNATVDDPIGRRMIDGTMTVEGAQAGAYRAAAKVTARGPLDALALTVDATSPDVAGSAARLATRGTLDANGRTLALASLEARWKQQTLRLLSPTRIGFADGVSIDRLRLGLRQAELEVAGHAGTALDLTARLRLPADLAAMVAPAYAADGSIAADARITGTSARPQGTVRLTASGLHLRSGPGQALPPANLTANVTLNGTSAEIDTRASAGRSRLAVTGTAPLAASGTLNLRTDGLVDLAMLDPLLAADGERARGQVTLQASISGTTSAPRVSGTARLAGGDFQDIPLGVRLTGITALAEANGDTIRLSSLTAQAGPGTMGGSGTISLAGDMPVDLRFTANNARPLSSDLLTAIIDMDLRLQGEVKGALLAAGTLHVRRADVRVPERLPSSVAVLPVRDAGAPPPPPQPPSKPLDLNLDLILDAPQQVFIRGRGLDVELGGRIHIGGTAADPQPDGGLNLRRGTLSVVGQTLTFTQGSVTFTGAGITDPAINLVAQNVTSALTATLTVSGSAKDPKVTLSSVPEEPQDEILAQLLFSQSTSKLSPFQMAEIAAALASLSGAPSGLTDPLSSIRETLGLDRLSVGSGSNGAPTLEAGSYLARGVYVGAKQSTSGNGTQATVQVDLAKGLKAEATAGSGTTNATGATGSADAASVGLTYQFEY